jgi:hypothetical protein
MEKLYYAFLAGIATMAIFNVMVEYVLSLM